MEDSDLIIAIKDFIDKDALFGINITTCNDFNAQCFARAYLYGFAKDLTIAFSNYLDLYIAVRVQFMSYEAVASSSLNVSHSKLIGDSYSFYMGSVQYQQILNILEDISNDSLPDIFYDMMGIIEIKYKKYRI